MIIAFSGHRNCVVDEEYLGMIRDEFEGAQWLHGGAKGFDSQVQAFAEKWQIECQTLAPDYASFPPKLAPLIRDRKLVEQADLLVACYDGRETGGTAYTIHLAQARQLTVITLQPKEYVDNGA